MFFPFGAPGRPVRPSNTWFYAGLASDFVDIQPPDADAAMVKTIADAVPCTGADSVNGCKVFHVSEDYGPTGPRVVERKAQNANPDALSTLKGEVLVFKYKGKIHAIDHKCPHSSYPLSDAALFDIEDFGIVLSAGLTCPKHGWSFDIFTGLGDRGSYRLKIWEVELRNVRPNAMSSEDGLGKTEVTTGSSEKEVWVRRKPRIG